MEVKGIRSKIREIIKEQINIELKDDDLLLDNGVDSISLINIIVEIENCFNIEFEPEDLNYKVLKSITDIANCINKLQY